VTVTALDVHEIAQRRLAAVDQRYSDGRRQLVEALRRSAHPMVATDIVEATRNLPQSSVYRNLAVLESAGVVVKVLTNGDRSAFELAEELKGHHHHLVCVTCGQVLDIEIPEKVEKMLGEGLAPVVADAGFVLTGHRLDLLGRCAQCR
jgi:Fur family ferric uptake transcriptional regulator